LKMVTHMVFTPVFFFDSHGVSRLVGAWVVFGSSLAAGPFVASGLDLLFFFSFVLFVPRDDEEPELVAIADGAARDGLGDGGGAPPPPPPSAPSGLPKADEAAEAGEADEEGEHADEEPPSRSRLHSSLWPARHADRWQAWLQYFRCRHPEHFCSTWSVAGAPQNAHSSIMCVKGVRREEDSASKYRGVR